MAIRPGNRTEGDGTMIVLGNSMSPTLRALDVVTIIPPGSSELRLGDVILFPSPVSNLKVVHRIVAFDHGGIVTRGDNSIVNDPWTVRYDNVIGRVEHALRDGRSLRVRGGRQGRYISLGLYAVRVLVFTLKRIAYPIYRALWRSGIFRVWIPRSLRPRVLSFNRPEGTESQLIMGKKIIGIRRPCTNRWVIKAPYRLFVDEAALVTALPHDKICSERI